MKPGGWVEWHEKHPLFGSDDGSLLDDSAITQWGRLFFEASEKFGTTATSPRYLKQRMEKVGFINVHEHILKIPVGLWPKDARMKEIGLFEMVNLIEGAGALSLKLFTRGLGWSREEVEVFLVGLRKDAANRSIHSWHTL